jgi:hypothetical protein
MLTRKGRVKILDFGLARMASERSTKGPLTAQGVSMGTPNFMAPEQADEPRQADIRADIYSLGCTLYYLLSGKPPFLTGSPIQKGMAHIDRQPRPMRELREEVPEDLAGIVARMMQKDPADRYQIPIEVVRDLVPLIKCGTTPLTSQGRNSETGEERTVEYSLAAIAEALPVADDSPSEAPQQPPEEVTTARVRKRKRHPRRRAASSGRPLWLTVLGISLAGLLAVAGILFLLYCLGVFTRSPTVRPPTETPESEWVQFTPMGEGYRVGLPKLPSRLPNEEGDDPADSRHRLTLDDGSEYEIQHVSLAGRAEVLFADDVFRGVRDDLLAEQPGARLEDEKSLRLAGAYPGTELRISFPDARRARVRAFLVGQKLYLLLVEAPVNKFNERDAQKFFDSFQLVGTP